LQGALGESSKGVDEFGLSLPIRAKWPDSTHRLKHLTVDSMPDHCALCERLKETESEFCSLHNAAERGLDSAYPAWKKACGNLTRAEYFVRLERLNETGSAVKDLIRHLREKGAMH
jgi:hypothetical protein